MLHAIVQDVGADRAFLLSEQGFQAGAIECANHTNIDLTSLEILREKTREYLTNATLSGLYFKVSDTMRDMHLWTSVTIHETKQSSYGTYMEGSLEFVGRLSILERALFEAMRGKYPVIVSLTDDEKPILAKSADELIRFAHETIAQAEVLIEKGKTDEKMLVYRRQKGGGRNK